MRAAGRSLSLAKWGREWWRTFPTILRPIAEAALTTSPVCDRHHRIPDWLRVRVGTMQTNDSQQQSWRDRAREIRALGDQMHDRLAKDEMLRLANKYERLADWTEEQARHSSAIP
jgi:hypothetical protein